MKKTSLTRALFVAGMMAMAGGMAQADAIFYPDGTSVNLGENAVENGTADRVLAWSSSSAPSSIALASLGVSADQSQIFASSEPSDDSSMIASSESVDTTILGAGPATLSSTTVVSTTPVYVFPNIDWDRSTVMSQPHPMMSHLRSFPADRFDRSAAATFDSPTRAGEASTMTSGAPNLVTDNERVGSVPPPLVDTTTLGAGSSSLGSSECGPSGQNCTYLPD